MLQVRKEVSLSTTIINGTVGVLVVLLAWVFLASLNILPPFSVPNPLGVLKAFGGLVTEYNLMGNVLTSWWRIFQAFTLAVVIALPLGLLMGAFQEVYALVSPITSGIRSMPMPAFLPIFLAIFGLDETMKVAYLFFAIFFTFLAVVVEEIHRVDQILVESAETLGAKTPQVLWVLFRAALPAIFSNFKVMFDIGWAYVIMVEVINAKMGVGYMIEAARKVLDFNRVYAALIAIGLVAAGWRWFLGWLETKIPGYVVSNGRKK